MVVESASEVEPDLRFGEDGELGCVSVCESAVESPDINESLEYQSFHIEDVIHAPNTGELDGNVGLAEASVKVIHEGQGECIGEIGVVQEIFCAEAPDSGTPCAAVIFEVGAEVLQVGVLPEIDAAFNFEIAAVDRTASTWNLVLVVGAVVIVIDEEEGITEFVALEHLKGGSHIIAAVAEVIEQLNILGLCSLSKCERCKGSGEKDFFGQKM